MDFIDLIGLLMLLGTWCVIDYILTVAPFIRYTDYILSELKKEKDNEEENKNE